MPSSGRIRGCGPATRENLRVRPRTGDHRAIPSAPIVAQESREVRRPSALRDPVRQRIRRGHPRLCDERTAGAIGHLDRAGDPWEKNAALWHKALSLYRKGDHAAAADMGRALHQEGVRLGDTLSQGVGLDIWAKASGGRVSAALIAALDVGEGDVQTKSAVLQAEGVRLLAQGSVEAAVETFRAAVDLTSTSGTVNIYVVSALTWLASAYRCSAEAASALGPRERRRRSFLQHPH